MTVPRIRTKSGLVAAQATAIQASASGLIDFTVGSILLAASEAVSDVAMWLQGAVLTLLSTTRASTSVGIDLDTWMADFGLTRSPATVAGGLCTFSRYTSGVQAVVPIGATVSSSPGSLTFSVVADASNPAYSAGLGGYLLPIGTASVQAPVVATARGAAGNVAPSVISTVSSAIPGVSLVTNVLTFTGGSDAESDAALRLRFTRFLASLSKGTPAAILAAVTALGPTIQANIVENKNPDGSTHLGFFYVVADDGSGAPPNSFLINVANAIEAVREVSVSFEVLAPTLLNVNAATTLRVALGYDPATVLPIVQAKITAFLEALGLGASLDYNRLIQVIYDAHPGVSAVLTLVVNGGTVSLPALAGQSIRPGAVTATAP